MVDFRPDPAWHIPIVSFDQDVAAAGKLNMSVGDLLFGADVKSLPLFRRDRLLRTRNPPCVDHRFARQFVISAPFGENFGRGTGGAKKARVQGLDQGERLDPCQQGVRPRRAGSPKSGLGRNRGGAEVQRHECSYPAKAHIDVSIRYFTDWGLERFPITWNPVIEKE
jgi:hypothetical protein